MLIAISSFRWLGRSALPLFGYLFTNGISYTSSFTGYYLRLLTFALISQIPYSIFLNINGFPNDLNILFLLVCTYPVIHYIKRRAWFEVVVFGVLALVYSAYCGYGLYGLGLLISIYLFSELDEIVAWLYWLLATFYGYLSQVHFQVIIFGLPILFSGFQKLPLGRKARWFYWFYPLHFIPLIALKYVTSL